MKMRQIRSKTLLFWKFCEEFVRIRSLYDGFLGFLKQLLLCSFQTLLNPETLFSSTSTLKSPSRILFSRSGPCFKLFFLYISYMSVQEPIFSFSNFELQNFFVQLDIQKIYIFHICFYICRWHILSYIQPCFPTVPVRSGLKGFEKPLIKKSLVSLDHYLIISRKNQTYFLLSL